MLKKCLYQSYLCCSAHGYGFIRTLLKRMFASTRFNTSHRITRCLRPHVNVRGRILREVGGDGTIWIQKCWYWLTRRPFILQDSRLITFLLSIMETELGKDEPYPEILALLCMGFSKLLLLGIVNSDKVHSGLEIDSRCWLLYRCSCVCSLLISLLTLRVTKKPDSACHIFSPGIAWHIRRIKSGFNQ